MDNTYFNTINALNNLNKCELTPDVLVAWSKAEELVKLINTTVNNYDNTIQNFESITLDDAEVMVKKVIPALLAERVLRADQKSLERSEGSRF